MLFGNSSIRLKSEMTWKIGSISIRLLRWSSSDRFSFSCRRQEWRDKCHRERWRKGDKNARIICMERERDYNHAILYIVKSVKLLILKVWWTISDKKSRNWPNNFTWCDRLRGNNWNFAAIRVVLARRIIKTVIKIHNCLMKMDLRVQIN